MSIQSGLYSILSQIPDVGQNVYPLVLPQKGQLPAIVYQRVGGSDASDINGIESIDIARFQIKAYAKSYSQSADIAESIKTALSGKGIKIMHIDDYEPEAALFVQILDYKLSNDIVK